MKLPEEFDIIIDENMVTSHREHWLEKFTYVVKHINKTNGWFDTERTFGDDIALLHSELSEALEAFRKYGTDDVTQNFGTDIGTYPKPEGVGSELADVLVRLLDTASRYNIDLEGEFLRKLQYNATRGYRHGNRRL